jgi:hypothetical protein
MKNSFIRRLALLGISASCLSHVTLYSVPFSFLVDQAVPDGLDTGIASTKVVSGLDGRITHLSVNLNLAGRGAGGWNGDLYATLVHNSGFAVLLNRPGKTDSDLLGFDDNGLTVTLDDLASRDIHNYRDSSDSLAGPLNGLWQPDGRNVDPASVTDLDLRNQSLSDFDGLDPNGNWTLFVADLEYGGTLQLISWGVNITATAVPDSDLLGLGAAAICAIAALGGTRGYR